MTEYDYDAEIGTKELIELPIGSIIRINRYENYAYTATKVGNKFTHGEDVWQVSTGRTSTSFTCSAHGAILVARGDLG